MDKQFRIAKTGDGFLIRDENGVIYQEFRTRREAEKFLEYYGHRPATEEWDDMKMYYRYLDQDDDYYRPSRRPYVPAYTPSAARKVYANNLLKWLDD